MRSLQVTPVATGLRRHHAPPRVSTRDLSEVHPRMGAMEAQGSGQASTDASTAGTRQTRPAAAAPTAPTTLGT